jgi:hypothetical protein
MTEAKWRQGIINHCDNIEQAYKDMMKHIDSVSVVDSDPDELIAFMAIKFTRLNKSIEEITG